jgi:hypothetical protein
MSMKICFTHILNTQNVFKINYPAQALSFFPAAEHVP